MKNNMFKKLVAVFTAGLLALVPVVTTAALDTAGAPAASDAYASLFTVAGQCTTSFSGSSNSRINNIMVASARLNGVVLMPGQAMSIDAAILPRTAENGYKTAGVYSGGKTVQGMGGGICQVSSTVYNAVMNAGLTTITRYPHSMPVSYLPIGMDAAIASGTKDLIFMNPYDTPVLLTTACDPNTNTLSAYVFVMTASLAGRSYVLRSVKTGGLSADTFRDVYLNGVLVGTEYVGHSSYMPHK